MNLFKKALVASAVVASFGANATATVASTPLELSAEGATAGVVPAAQFLSLDIVVGTDHPSASTITLTFDANVDLGTIVGLTSGVTTAIVNNPGAGTGEVDDGTGTGVAVADGLRFSYGTGSFTFDNVTYTDNDQTLGQFDTISFVVNLGNPLTADSAFRIETMNSGTATVLYSGIANVDYSAVTAAGDAIETGTSALSVTVPQFSFGSGLDFDAVINRDNNLLFVDATDIDIANFSVTNDETLAGAILASEFDLDLTGTFTGRTGTEFAFDIDGTAASTTATVTPVSEDGVQQEFVASEIADDGTVSVVTSTFDGGGSTNIVATGNITADFVLTGTTSTITTPGFLPYTIAADLDAGEWVVDATTINVPYFPAGFTGTSSSVHFANESVNSSDVIVSAIDDDGIVHGPLDLGFDLAGNTVTKVTQTAIMSLFGLTESTKLSVTFNIEAEDGDVNAYAFTVSDGGRAQLVTSQQNNNQ
jgi:hypothetical protein